MVSRRSTHPLLALALGIATAGCSQGLDDLPRVPVSGTVTMDGKPLPAGAIQFSPIGEVTANSAGATGEIREGKFAIPREAGPVPGNYRVAISHAESQEVKGKNDSGVGRKRLRLGPEQIPAKYNARSELKQEIKPGGASDLKFDLHSK